MLGALLHLHVRLGVGGEAAVQMHASAAPD